MGDFVLTRHQILTSQKVYLQPFSHGRIVCKYGYGHVSLRDDRRVARGDRHVCCTKQGTSIGVSHPWNVMQPNRAKSAAITLPYVAPESFQSPFLHFCRCNNPESTLAPLVVVSLLFCFRIQI